MALVLNRTEQPDEIVLFDADRRPSRRCGDCQLCCKLVPVEELHKTAGQRCRHQKVGKGCAIYDARPTSCALWNCRWLVEHDAAILPRPDRAHYVLDMMPDYVTLQPHDGSPVRHLPVIQVWVDPAFPDAHRAASLRAWLDRKRTCALIRYNARDGFLLAPPSVTGAGWEEQASDRAAGKPHGLVDVVAKLGGDVGENVTRETIASLRRLQR